MVSGRMIGIKFEYDSNSEGISAEHDIASGHGGCCGFMCFVLLIRNSLYGLLARKLFSQLPYPHIALRFITIYPLLTTFSHFHRLISHPEVLFLFSNRSVLFYFWVGFKQMTCSGNAECVIPRYYLPRYSFQHHSFCGIPRRGHVFSFRLSLTS